MEELSNKNKALPMSYLDLYHTIENTANQSTENTANQSTEMPLYIRRYSNQFSHRALRSFVPVKFSQRIFYGMV